MRQFKFQTDEYYHIYNRGVEKRDIFGNDKDFLRFLNGLREFNNNSYKEERDYIIRKAKEESQLLSSGQPELRSWLSGLPKLVDIICYCLIPNHYHFILKQLSEDGISKFIHKLSLGYTQYFNTKYKRSGSLFQGTYKAIKIDSDSYLLWLSCYINGNPEIHKIFKAEDWIWSSYKDYLEERSGTLCNKKIILDLVNNAPEDYRELANEVIIKSSERKEEMKKILLEE